jgi:hypothetical protein
MKLLSQGIVWVTLLAGIEITLFGEIELHKAAFIIVRDSAFSKIELVHY